MQHPHDFVAFLKAGFLKLEFYFEKSTRFVALVGCSMLLVAVTVTCLSILGKLFRRLFNAFFGADFNPVFLNWVRPILGEEEIVQLSVGMTLFAIIPWVTLNKGHIRIDVLKHHFSQGFNHVLNIISDGALVIITYMLMNQQWYLVFKKPYSSTPSAMDHLLIGDFPQFLSRIKIRDETQILSLPLWPFYLTAELLVILLFVVALFCLVRSLFEIFVKA